MTEPDLDELAEALAEFDVPQRDGGRSAREERIVAGFEEIQRFVEQHGRKPLSGEERDIPMVPRAIFSFVRYSGRFTRTRQAVASLNLMRGRYSRTKRKRMTLQPDISTSCGAAPSTRSSLRTVRSCTKSESPAVT